MPTDGVIANTTGAWGEPVQTPELYDQSSLIQTSPANATDAALAAAIAAEVARANAAYESQGGTAGKWVAAVIGSSREAGGQRGTDGTVVQVGNSWNLDAIGVGQAGPTSWFTYACLLSGGRMVHGYNGGVGSDTTTGMLARFATEVLTKPVTHVFIGDAHNDFSVGSGITEATTRANILAMIAATKAAGKTPVLYTCLPDNSSVYAHPIRRHNIWLRMVAEGLDRTAGPAKLTIVDPAGAVIDSTSTSGGYVAAYTSDSTHLSYAGALAAGTAVLAQLAGALIGATATPAWLPKTRIGGIGRNVTLTSATTSSQTVTATAASFTTNDVGRPVTWSGAPTGVYISAYTSSTQVTLSQTVTITNGTVLTLGAHPNLLANPLMQDDVNFDGVADSWSFTAATVLRTVTDGVTTNGSAVITSATAAFVSTDKGRVVTGTGIPANAAIKTVDSATQVTLTANATVTNTGVTLNLLGLARTLTTDAAVLGNVETLLVSAGTVSGNQGLTVDSVNISTGDRLKFVGMMKVTANAGSLNYEMSLTFPGASTTYTCKATGQIVGLDMDWFYFEFEGVVPAGATLVRPGPITSSGTGTIQFGQCGLFNLTKMAA